MLGYSDTQSCPILCDPLDCSPPGASVHGILQATILEWVALLRRLFPTPGIELLSLAACIGSGFFTTGPPGKPQRSTHWVGEAVPWAGFIIGTADTLDWLILGWGDCTLHSRMFSSIPALNHLDASSNLLPQIGQSKMSPNCKMFPSGQNHPLVRTTTIG